MTESMTMESQAYGLDEMDGEEIQDGEYMMPAIDPALTNNLSEEQIEEQIRQLNSEDFVNRQVAYGMLEQIGRLPEGTEASESAYPDPSTVQHPMQMVYPQGVAQDTPCLHDSRAAGKKTNKRKRDLNMQNRAPPAKKSRAQTNTQINQEPISEVENDENTVNETQPTIISTAKPGEKPTEKIVETTLWKGANKQQFTLSETGKVTEIDGESVNSLVAKKLDPAARLLVLYVYSRKDDLNQQGLVKKSELKSSAPEELQQYITQRGNFHFTSPTRLYTAEELGIHEGVFDYLDNVLRGSLSDNSNMYHNASNEPRQTKPTDRRQPKDGDGRFKKTRNGLNVDVENEDVGDLTKDKTVAPAKCHEAILYVLAGGRITAKQLGMDRIGKVYRKFVDASVAMCERMVKLESWVEEQRATLNSKLQKVRTGEKHYRLMSREYCDVATTLRDFIQEDRVVEALKAAGIDLPEEVSGLKEWRPAKVPPKNTKHHRDQADGRSSEMKQKHAMPKNFVPLTPTLPLDFKSDFLSLEEIASVMRELNLTPAQFKLPNPPNRNSKSQAGRTGAASIGRTKVSNKSTRKGQPLSAEYVVDDVDDE